MKTFCLHFRRELLSNSILILSDKVCSDWYKMEEIIFCGRMVTFKCIVSVKHMYSVCNGSWGDVPFTLVHCLNFFSHSPLHTSQQPSFPGFLQVTGAQAPLLEHSINPPIQRQTSHLPALAGTSCPAWYWRPAYWQVWDWVPSQTGQQVAWSRTGSIQLITGQSTGCCFALQVMEPSWKKSSIWFNNPIYLKANDG